MSDPTRAAAEEIGRIVVNDSKYVREEITAILRKHFAPEALIGVGLEMAITAVKRCKPETEVGLATSRQQAAIDALDSAFEAIRSLSTLSTDDMIERMAHAVCPLVKPLLDGEGTPKHGCYKCKPITTPHGPGEPACLGMCKDVARAALSSITGEGK